MRRAFTLIEILVVIGLMAVLFTLAVAIVPNSSSRSLSSGASQLQAWLLTAKNRALRDGVPRGIRLVFPDSVSVNYPGGTTGTVQYIEQPEDYSGVGTIGIAALSSTIDGFGANFLTTGSVQVGDYVQIDAINNGRVFRVSGTSTDSALTVSANSSLAWPSGYTGPPGPGSGNYRIMRQPAPTIGEAPLRLPQNIVVDTNAGFSSTQVNDILFSPTGEVTGRGASTGKIILYVRDHTKAQNAEDTLIVVYPRTGFIASHPVYIDPVTPDPYRFTRDGRASGL